MSANFKDLKAIRFSGQLLPAWAQLLDVAARLCPVSEEARGWFCRFTTRAGVADARTVMDYCRVLREQVEAKREAIGLELQRTVEDAQPAQILGAWIYALDTMIQEAQSNKSCAWIVEGENPGELDNSDGGDITLRRV